MAAVLQVPETLRLPLLPKDALCTGLEVINLNVWRRRVEVLPVGREGRTCVVVALTADGAGRIRVAVHQEDAPRVAIVSANRRARRMVVRAHLNLCLKRLIARRIRHFKDGVIGARRCEPVKSCKILIRAKG